MVEQLTIILTFILAFTIFTVVCLPMTNRASHEKLFMLCIGISVLAAGLDRVAHLFQMYDADGSVSLLAETVVSVSRFFAEVYGVIWCVTYLGGMKSIFRRISPDNSHAVHAVHRKTH